MNDFAREVLLNGFAREVLLNGFAAGCEAGLCPAEGNGYVRATPWVRAEPDRRPKAIPGAQPSFFLHSTGGAEPRLTSGGKAAQATVRESGRTASLAKRLKKLQGAALIVLLSLFRGPGFTQFGDVHHQPARGRFQRGAA